MLECWLTYLLRQLEDSLTCLHFHSSRDTPVRLSAMQRNGRRFRGRLVGAHYTAAASCNTVHPRVEVEFWPPMA
jgi:hypothetical protein